MSAQFIGLGLRQRCTGARWHECRGKELLSLLACCVIAFAAAGCAERRVQAQPSFDAGSRPVIPPANPVADSSADVPPDLEAAAPPDVSIPVAHSAPPRPRSAVAQPSPDMGTEPPTSPHAAPQLQPRLSAQEQTAAERQTNESIQVAEKNLQSALGRQLNPTQADLVGKIRTFLGQAREAIRDGDWLRALNLAKKAQVLSAELASSS